KLAALLQNANAHGSSDVTPGPGIGDLQQHFLPGTGGYKRQSRLYTANATARVGEAAIVSVSGYQVNKTTRHDDYTPYYSTYTQQYFGVAGAPDIDAIETKKFTQEVRLSLPIGTALDWLIGAFYTHETSSTDQLLGAADPQTGVWRGVLGDFN